MSVNVFSPLYVGLSVGGSCPSLCSIFPWDAKKTKRSDRDESKKKAVISMSTSTFIVANRIDHWPRKQRRILRWRRSRAIADFT